ncbi:neural cell adhesion molecule L1-like protein precursor, partial [Silurus asotus]
VEHPPTITSHSERSVVAVAFEDNFTLTCEATGNPKPVIYWTKNNLYFNPHNDVRLKTFENSGSFVIPNNKNLGEYQGKYRCYASNKLGVAMSEETHFMVPTLPKFPKEIIEPAVVKVGDSVVLECNPPNGIPPRQLYWMTIDLQHIDQDERVSMGLNGNLYFSNVQEKDSRSNYCCFASFPKIRTIVQKTALAIVVMSFLDRKPNLLVPSGDLTQTYLVQGEDLEIECIAEGLPTPTIEWTKIEGKLPKRSNIRNHGKWLTVPKVTEEDNGKYMCKAKNSAGQATHVFDITVEEPPYWVQEPKSQIVPINSEVHIKCYASGKPQPTIAWMRNGEPLQAAPLSNVRVLHDTLILYEAQQQDSAVYQCEVSNKHGTLLSNANIMVMNVPDPPVDLILSDLRDRSVMLHWMPTKDHNSPITGNVHVRWFTICKIAIDTILCMQLNYSDFCSEFIIEFEENHWEPGNWRPLLRVSSQQNSAPLSLYGHINYQFRVSAVNAIGKGHPSKPSERYKTPPAGKNIPFYFHLNVPDPPVDLILSDLRDRSVMLHWMPTKDHNSPITEFIIEFEENHWEPGNWRPLLRVSSQQNSAPLSLYGHINYQFRVSAVNAIGKGHPSKPSERYKTPPAAPDRNPENIKIEGHSPHQMDITWEPLMPIEHNGPGLEYKLSYRQMGVEESWTEKMVKRHSFIVKDTPTYVPYEVKVHAFNNHGGAVEPSVVFGYSGEDLPDAAPENVHVVVLNSTLIQVSWSPVQQTNLRGHLEGYSVHWWRTQSLLTSTEVPAEKQFLIVPGNQSYTIVPGLKPFSQYRLTVNVFNRKGSGPSSKPLTFTTPQGGKHYPPILRATNPQDNSITLVWAPPSEANGVLTGYKLQYQILNDTLDIGKVYRVNISGPDTTQLVLHDLESGSFYKFQLSACTHVGCGPAISEDGLIATLALDGANHFANCSCRNSNTKSTGQWTGSNWSRKHQAVNRCHLAAYNLFVEGALDWKMVSTTSVVRLEPLSYAEGVHETLSSKSWFIGIMCAVALLTLVVLIACFVTKNKAGMYAGK